MSRGFNSFFLSEAIKPTPRIQFIFLYIVERSRNEAQASELTTATGSQPDGKKPRPKGCSSFSDLKAKGLI